MESFKCFICEKFFGLNASLHKHYMKIKKLACWRRLKKRLKSHALAKRKCINDVRSFTVKSPKEHSNKKMEPQNLFYMQEKTTQNLNFKWAHYWRNWFTQVIERNPVWMLWQAAWPRLLWKMLWFMIRQNWEVYFFEKNFSLSSPNKSLNFFVLGRDVVRVGVRGQRN